MNNDKQKQITYTTAESIVIENADAMLETCSNNLLATQKAVLQAWHIQVQKDKSIENTNPFEYFLDMLKYYANQAKNNYATYCKEHGIANTDEQKQLVNNLNESNLSRIAKVEPITQIKKLIME